MIKGEDKMYIEKYWANYIGGTDDSLTLIDYLYDKGKTEISLNEIFNDTGLSRLNWNLSINSLNFPLFSRLSAIENSIYVSFSLVFALIG